MKTMLKGVLLISMSLLLVNFELSAQSAKIQDNPDYGANPDTRMECAANLSTMSEFVKIKVYEHALDAWRSCFNNCPKSSKNIYIQGAKIIEYMIEHAATDELKNAWIDTLMILHDKRIENFGEEGKVLGKKGLDLMQYRKEDMKISFTYLEKSLDLEKSEADEAVAINYFSISNVLFKNKEIGADKMVTNYMKAIECMEGKLKTTHAKGKTEDAIANIEKIFAESGAADCEALVGIFTPKYEAAPTDIELLKKITSLLDKTNCQKDYPLYTKASESLYAVQPNAAAASNLAKLFALKDDLVKAKQYYTLAAEQETDPSSKANYLYQLSTIEFQNKRYTESRRYALEAIKYRADYGDAYMLIGSAYAASSSDCGSSSSKIERGAVYWAAVDKFIKAKNVDPSVTERANEMISRYSKYFPNNEDCFFEGLTDGKSYTVRCWINEDTVVRTTKN